MTKELMSMFVCCALQLDRFEHGSPNAVRDKQVAVWLTRWRELEKRVGRPVARSEIAP